MARITFVKKAQASKYPRRCDKCGKEIVPGMPYKHTTTRPYGPTSSQKHVRCGDCPTWQPWELSTSKMAAIWRAEAEFDTALESVETPDDVQSALEDLASVIREVAEEYEESASNIEDGFGHETYQSEELREKAEALDSWADEVESADVPDLDDYKCQACEGEGEVDCETCNGEGQVQDESDDADDGDMVECSDCDGSGKQDCSECDGDTEYVDLDAWREAVSDATSVAHDCPV